MFSYTELPSWRFNLPSTSFTTLRRPISKTQSAFLLLRGAVCEKNSTHLDAIVPFAAVVATGCMCHATLMLRCLMDAPSGVCPLGSRWHAHGRRRGLTCHQPLLLLRCPISKTQSAFLLLRGALCEKNGTHLDGIAPFAAVAVIGVMYHATPTI